MKTIDIILIILIAILSVISGTLIYICYFDDLGTNILSDIDVKNDIISACSDKNVFDTTYCLHSHIDSFFTYNISNNGNDLTFEQLKTEGGTCLHWTNLYKNLADRLGFENEPVDIYSKDKDKSGHIFLVIYNMDEGYCILDQDVKPFCVRNDFEE